MIDSAIKKKRNTSIFFKTTFVVLSYTVSESKVFAAMGKDRKKKDRKISHTDKYSLIQGQYIIRCTSQMSESYAQMQYYKNISPSSSSLVFSGGLKSR